MSPTRCGSHLVRTRLKDRAGVSFEGTHDLFSSRRIPYSDRPVCEPDTMRVPSGENLTDQTESVCPLRGFITSSPVLASHIRIVVSSEPDTIRVPSGENPTDQTPDEWPLSSRTGFRPFQYPLALP